MRSAYAQFRENMKRVRDLAALAENLTAQTTGVLDLSDLLRASLVLAVSALDHFVHEITRKGMLETASGKRLPTDAYGRFSISLAATTNLLANPGQFSALNDEIQERHGYLSFQDPNKIADAFRHISGKELWKEVGRILGINKDDAKARLKLIVDRRNQIAHEADMDPTSPGARWPIDLAVVADALKVLEETADSLFSVAITS